MESGLDTINKELNTSKRYITSMKSWFAPVKNYFSPDTDPAYQSSGKSSTSASRDHISQSKSSNFSSQSDSSSGQQQLQQKDFRLFSDAETKHWSSAQKQNEERCNENLRKLCQFLRCIVLNTAKKSATRLRLEGYRTVWTQFGVD